MELIMAHENVSKKGKNVVLKSLKRSVGLSFVLVIEEEYELVETSEDEDADKVALLVKRINRLITKRAEAKNKFIRKKEKKVEKEDSSKNKSVCYECKQFSTLDQVVLN